MNSLRQTVLIVDDIVANLEVLAEVLGDDFEVLVATNGNDALKIAEEQSPDLVLLDIMMPDLDGYETCIRLKENRHTRQIPVIFVTALDREVDEARGLEVGAIDYITKPFSPPIVKARVKNHLELKHQRDILENLAFIDGLTGISNRRQFDRRIEEEWRRASRNGELLSLILIDIDFFKKYNDHYGHLAGDDCLKQVAETLASSLKRPGDAVARYGGEEFACILPQTDAEGVNKLAETLRQAVANLRIPHAASTVTDHVTLSLGVATCSPTPATSPESLVTAADKMLYMAKEEGRNRAVGYRP
ncbi:MAG: PleD family two-component system response regulator [Nitrospirota bacterium]|nr:PleD family two-component system response regulator [Nitrospirota bacterium]